MTGENFAKWKSNINLLLVNEDLRIVLMEECPPEPVAKAAREAFDHWVRANNKVKVYMLAGMSELLRRQHE